MFLLCGVHRDECKERSERNDGRHLAQLDTLWREISVQANGGRVSIPVIGGGQSRLSQILPAQDSIRFTALSFILASRREKVCDELAIVVQPKEFEKLDRMEIQSFLRSLRPS